MNCVQGWELIAQNIMSFECTGECLVKSQRSVNSLAERSQAVKSSRCTEKRANL